MKSKLTKLSAFIISLAIIFAGVASAEAVERDEIDEKINSTSEYLLQLQTPTVSSTGGEWMIIGLARNNTLSDKFKEGYYENVENYITANSSSKLSSSKSTENSRVIIALTAIGKDPSEVAGCNLFEPLADFDYVINQGINGPIWALIALDTAKWDIPNSDSSSVQTTRESLVNYIIEQQLSDGGWALTGSSIDPDITGMAIQALAPFYGYSSAVKNAVDQALEKLSSIQADNGGFTSWGSQNSESCAQVITALTSLGINPETDSRFIKNGTSVLDALMSFSTDNGFSHSINGAYNQMATEQAFYALVSYARLCDSGRALYDMSDTVGTVFKDINDDGAINVSDCTCIQKYIVGNSTLSLTQLYYSDINNDSVINVVDVTQLQKAVVS